MIDVLFWILFGGLVGWITLLTVHSPKPLNGPIVIGTGVVGALIGGALISRLNGTSPTGFDLPSLLAAVCSAVVLLTLFTLTYRHRHSL